MVAAGVPTGEIALRVTARLGRREAITKRNPAHLLVLLGQGALNQEIGGREAMVAQIQYLLEMAARPNVELRVIPDRCGWHPGLEGAFALIESATKPEASIVFVETRRSVLMLHEDRDIAAYRRAIDRIMKIALPSDASLNFIADLRKRMEKTLGTRGHLAKVKS